MNAAATGLFHALGAYQGPVAEPWVRLSDQLRAYQDTAFGRAHDFAGIRSEADFRERVPVMDGDDYAPWIARAAAGEAGVLACGRLLGFERTSGSGSAAKWIPITDGLRTEFARGLAGWLHGLRRRAPEVFHGRAYWALSPPGMMPETSAGGLPVGMTSDAAYFPESVGQGLAEWLAIPPLSGAAGAAFEETAEFLLGVPDLGFISVWSPTFLLALDRALRDLRPGFCWRGQWPGLRMVSCWADASSTAWMPELQARLGTIPIEPKGLLATEGITSIPDEIDATPKLASGCHYHEFLDASGAVVPPALLREGAVYQVLLTTAGGLYRYRTGDQVVVTAPGEGRPGLRFVGRVGAVSDLVGEKLSESGVVAALVAARARGFLQADAGAPGYVLWLEDVSGADAVVGGLRKNPYFDQALALRQLAPVVIRRLPDRWHERLAVALVERQGCRLGDVKIPALISHQPPTVEEVASWLG